MIALDIQKGICNQTDVAWQVSMRTQKNWNSHALMVGIKSNIATKENYLVVLQRKVSKEIEKLATLICSLHMVYMH
jgi:hypothetical protein